MDNLTTETVVHHVGDLNAVGRSAAETLVGHSLTENQQIVIQIVNPEGQANGSGSSASSDQLPEWCNVYAGLNDEQIATLEGAISRRLDLTRSGTIAR